MKMKNREEVKEAEEEEEVGEDMVDKKTKQKEEIQISQSMYQRIDLIVYLRNLFKICVFDV